MDKPNRPANRLYDQLKNQDTEVFDRQMKKSLLVKSFSNPKDNRGNCAMEQSELI
jgi:hypothetical protein